MAPEVAAANKRHIEGLPLSVVGPIDLGRLIRELEALENGLINARLRTPGVEVKMPKTSHAMDEVLSLNKLDLLKDEDRKALKLFLATVRARAPRLHMSFSADPSPAFINRIMAWLRDQVHPVVLLTVGLQPGIGAGCVVRTPNKYFDFSLSKDFAKHRDILMETLRGSAVLKVAQPAPVQPVVPATPVVQAVPAPAAPAPHAAEVHARPVVAPAASRPIAQPVAEGAKA